ncbi:ABC transporter ATP-binding protein [Dyadobacter pollutisoli]|uniref:ABC transporter ATP-binding protein n=1 Tax=Dyadobacter pollutisoli TaxID=2910158 RepID=A0A9E8SNB3_9BACT|nr:ABC transporter ATP-binding protein [Dyadobacter pollutisoli]WAC14129.1 ABC transporter ATP-binding protein [Dyadobacter pollutisoli]
MDNPIIELRGLTKSYGSFKAVDDLNLTINKGEIFGLLGPNGAGKTTTILMMLGLTDPTAGIATVCGHNATTEPLAVKRKVGYMPDSVGFYDNMTALENLVYIGRLNGIPESEVHMRALEVLDVIGLGAAADKKTSTFSRGMKQRLGLADVLIKKPEVIILDEPTLGIDPSGVREFLTMIHLLSKREGLTVLLSSHHLHQVQQVCDRVGIFVKGKMLAEGNIDTLSRNVFGGEAYIVNITLKNELTSQPEYLGELEQWQDVQRVTLSGHVLEVSCDKDVTPDIVRFAVNKGLDIMGVRKKEHGLDDIYEKYFENDSKVKNRNEKSV